MESVWGEIARPKPQINSVHSNYEQTELDSLLGYKLAQGQS